MLGLVHFDNDLDIYNFRTCNGGIGEPVLLKIGKHRTQNTKKRCGSISEEARIG